MLRNNENIPSYLGIEKTVITTDGGKTILSKLFCFFVVGRGKNENVILTM